LIAGARRLRIDSGFVMPQSTSPGASCFVPAHAPALPLHLVDTARFPAWRDAQPPRVRAWVEAHGFKGDALSFLVLPGDDGAPAAAVAGVSDPQDPVAIGHLPALLPALAFRIAADSPVAMAAGTALIGWGLGAYKFARYLKSVKPTARLAVDADAEPEALAVLAASTLARDLINTPTEHMGPDELEAEVQALASAHGAGFRCVRGAELLAQNLPAIHAVGRASHRAPRLIELTHGDPAQPHLVIVGKGVCFDTGGLDVKPPDGMRNMKKDMGGAAHAIALARLVLERALPVRLTLLVPAVENALGPDAYRPGEVIATRAGISVEIDNTDAEGRVILCDALTYASEQKPALIMDFATLTGAARIALGPDLPALFCNRDELAQAYLDAGSAQRDPLWRMPLWRPYLSYLKSGVADLANSGASRMAGCVTAALYLERFVPDAQAWTHVDVYSWNDADRPGKPAGGEAQGLRAAWSFLKQRFGA
jgi:leucyl aminopeptidase